MEWDSTRMWRVCFCFCRRTKIDGAATENKGQKTPKKKKIKGTNK